MASAPAVLCADRAALRQNAGHCRLACQHRGRSISDKIAKCLVFYSNLVSVIACDRIITAVT
ncbi:MAG TPA: hypothetical protein DEF43_17895 [Chloroflexus aurantiacus]|nr:hypothetical protein [Chloroflexus aurantiacus]